MKNPCILAQEFLIKNLNCSSVSIPSAITSISRLLAILSIAWVIRVLFISLLISFIKLISIFIASISKILSCERDATPAPKSSSITLIPKDLSFFTLKASISTFELSLSSNVIVSLGKSVSIIISSIDSIKLGYIKFLGEILTLILYPLSFSIINFKSDITFFRTQISMSYIKPSFSALFINLSGSIMPYFS